MKTFEEIWAEMNEGRRQAIVRKVARAQTGDESACEEVFRDVLSGKLRIVLKEGVAKLVDSNGRCIPLHGIKGIVDANRSYRLIMPEINYVAVLARFQEFFGLAMKFMAAAEFQERCQAAIERVKSDPRITNLIKGPHFPFVFPQLDGDLGQLLDDVVVSALERSYRAQFPKRQFTNNRHGELAGKVTIVAGTRQERLVEAMAKGSVCGVYFPAALQGFGIPADREFVGHLPKLLILSGVEVAAAVVAYPNVFRYGNQTLGLDMASLQWQSAEYSLRFEARDDKALFESRDLKARDCYSGGVSVLG